jgi:hypothetical protein
MRLVLASLILLAACGGKKTPDLSQLDAIKAEACACKDKACAEKIDQRMDELTQGLDEKDFEPRAVSTMLEIAGCVTALGVE